jgi:Protein of unknown function (DUF998)
MAARQARARVIDERQANRLLLACGVIGPPLFVIVFLIEGATRPGYSAWRHYVSQLSLGEGGWMQIANFLVCGLLSLCFALGLRRTLQGGTGATWGPLLLAIFGLGLIVAGIFVTDPALGYPPGAPPRPPGLVTHATLHGSIHGLAGLVVFSSVAAACFVLARRFASEPAWRGWAPYSVVTGVLVAVFFVASLATAPLPGGPSGLLQRLAIVAGWGWIALLAARLLGSVWSRDGRSPRGRL